MLDLCPIKRLLTSRVYRLPYTKLPAGTGESSASSGSQDNMVNLSLLALESSANFEVQEATIDMDEKYSH